MDGTIEEQYAADTRNYLEATYKAEYNTTGSYSHPDDEHRVTWVKDGTTRFRYTIEGEWKGSEGIGRHLVVISKPTEALYVLCVAADEVCCDDSDCASAASSLVSSLLFPIKFFELSDDEAASDIPVESWTDVIAGYEARCYRREDDSRELRSEVCYSADGVQLSLDYREGDFHTRKVVTDVSTISEADFELPLPLTEETSD